MRAHTLTLLLLALLVGCTPRVADDDDAADDDDSTADLPVIPDPGDATDDWGLEEWGDDGGCCATPETAYPVGTATMDAGYIQGFFDGEFQFFYVFRAAADLEEFTFPMWFEEVHMHDGAGLRFGGLIEPSASEANSVTWQVEPGGVYVVEVRSDFEGFF